MVERMMTAEQRVDRLRDFMDIMQSLYAIEPDILNMTDWNSNEDAYDQMVQLIWEGKV
jgi:hypothetical protein